MVLRERFTVLLDINDWG